MAGEGRYSGPYGKRGAEALNALVDFGPEGASSVPPTQPASPPAPNDITARLRRLVHEVQKISKRIDDLSDR